MARQLPRFRWNRQSALASLQARASARPASEPTSTGTPDQLIVQDWLSALQLLQGVPFNYLVPDIGMLPAESLRFFTLANRSAEGG